MARIDYLYQESLTLRVGFHSDMFLSQYPVNSLDEDHVCHGITTQELRLRPMKEISTLNITQLFLDSAQAGRKASRTCTYTVDSAIQLLGNNIVLKDCPPSIADEEQRLNRRQRCTLTQLRSVHCRTMSIGCSANQATSVLTVELHHKT